MTARIVILLVALPALAGALDLEARWTWLQGPFQRRGELRLRALEDGPAALRWTLPESALLPSAQVLLLDGEALLAWSEPEGAPGSLRPGDRRLAPLRALGAAFPAALISGRGLEGFLEIESEGRERGWTLLRGRLAGHPARLVLSRGRARSLAWELPAGSLEFRWSRGLRRGEPRLLILPEGGGKLLLETLNCDPGPLEPAALFFREE